MNKKIITLFISFFIAASISFSSSFAQPPKNQMKPGMLTNDSPYFKYLKNDNNNHSTFDYPVPPISGNVGYWIEQIDEDLVLNYIQGLVDFGPRVTESTACDNAGTYIYGEFEDMGLSVRYQYWDSGSLTGKNVEATLEGEDPTSDKIFIVLGHYDSVSGSPGADDNAAGTTAALAAAEILSQYRFRHTIRFLAVDGEEQGLHGSSEYAEEAVNNGDNIIAVLNADMIGFAPNEGDDEFIKIYTNTASEWLYHYIENISIYYDAEIGGLETIDDGYISNSDHASFVNYGYDATCYHEYNFNDYYHSPNDVIINMNMNYDAKVTRLVIATLAELAEPVVHEHDIIAKDLVIPSVIPHGETQIISATIQNGGNNSELNIITNFLVNDTILDSITIPHLNIMESALVNFTWNPAHGTYNAAIETQAIPNEGDLSNNNVNASVSVISAPAIAIDPLSLSFLILTGFTDGDNISIVNLASAEDDLDFIISFDGDFGGNWLSASPENGTVAINDSESVTIYVDSMDLTKGDYEGSVIISSNDVNDPEIIIPVFLSVVFGNDTGAVSVNAPYGLLPVSTLVVNATVENFGGLPHEDIIVNCTITSGVFGTFLEEDFSDGVPPAGWSQESDNEWRSHVGSNAGGTSPEAYLHYSYISGDYAYLDSTAVNTVGSPKLWLRFKHEVDYYSSSFYCRVLTRADSSDSWTDVTPWTNPVSSDIPAEECVVDISADIGTGTQVRFEFDGYNWNIDNWYLDDVMMYSSISRDDGNVVFTDEELIDLESFSSGLVEFSEWNPTGVGFYAIEVRTLLPDDQDPSNDAVIDVVELFLPGIISSLCDGWNCITLPFNESVNASELLVKIDGLDYSWSEAWNMGLVNPSVFFFDGISQVYNYMVGNDVILGPGVGYWFYSYEPGLLYVDNLTISLWDGIIGYLIPGWNNVGFPDDKTLVLGDIVVEFDTVNYSWSEAWNMGLVDPIVFFFNCSSQMYDYLLGDYAMLISGRGFWFYSYELCLIKVESD